jgi:predicted aspartyl protease
MGIDSYSKISECSSSVERSKDMQAISFEMPSAQVPFVVVEGLVNGHESAKILLDTGAAAPFTIMISPALAERANVEVGKHPTTPSTGAVGRTEVGFHEATVARFTLGGIELRNVATGVTPALGAVSQQLGTAIDGIVGYEFVKGRRISIDYGARKVDFNARLAGVGEAISFTLAPKRSLTLVKAEINGKGPFLLALDTAASATLISPVTARAAGLAGGQAVALGGAGGASSGGATITQATITLGHVKREKQNVAVADVLQPVRAASGAELDGVLGADFLAGRKITIDYPARQLWISKSEFRQ